MWTWKMDVDVNMDVGVGHGHGHGGVEVIKYRTEKPSGNWSVQYGQSITREKKTNNAGNSSVLEQGIFWSGTRPRLWMPTLVFFMPMPSYGQIVS
jgi:hypothetical protein